MVWVSGFDPLYTNDSINQAINHPPTQHKKTNPPTNLPTQHNKTISAPIYPSNTTKQPIHQSTNPPAQHNKTTNSPIHLIRVPTHLDHGPDAAHGGGERALEEEAHHRVHDCSARVRVGEFGLGSGRWVWVNEASNEWSRVERYSVV